MVPLSVVFFKESRRTAIRSSEDAQSSSEKTKPGRVISAKHPQSACTNTTKFRPGAIFGRSTRSVMIPMPRSSRFPPLQRLSMGAEPRQRPKKAGLRLMAGLGGGVASAGKCATVTATASATRSSFLVRTIQLGFALTSCLSTLTANDVPTEAFFYA